MYVVVVSCNDLWYEKYWFAIWWNIIAQKMCSVESLEKRIEIQNVVVRALTGYTIPGLLMNLVNGWVHWRISSSQLKSIPVEQSPGCCNDNNSRDEMPSCAACNTSQDTISYIRRSWIFQFYNKCSRDLRDDHNMISRYVVMLRRQKKSVFLETCCWNYSNIHYKLIIQ